MTAKLERRLERAKAKVAILEEMIETKTRELFLFNQRLESANARFSQLFRIVPAALVIVDHLGRVISANPAAARLLEYPSGASLRGVKMPDIWPECSMTRMRVREGEVRIREEATWFTKAGEPHPVLVSAVEYAEETRSLFVCVALDLTDQKRLEMELRQAQKLESLGQLAAGVAHEINTPIQFVGDNISFLAEAVQDLLHLAEVQTRVQRAGPNADRRLLAELDEAAEDADVEYLAGRAPKAADRATEGIRRVRDIVQGLKNYAHPSDEVTPMAFTRVIETTLAVAIAEYRNVADVEVVDECKAPVLGRMADLNQVLLNLVVNAAHAIHDAQKGRGRIVIRTRVDGQHGLLEVEDNGCGIPPEVQDRIFDPFFTTKEVGRGSGQGLAIAHSLIAQRQNGKLTFTTEPGRGTTFTIRLPLAKGSPLEAQGAQACDRPSCSSTTSSTYSRA